MLLLHQVFVDSAVVWQLWYALFLPFYTILVFFPRSHVAARLFGSGAFLALPAVYILLFTVFGASAWGLWFFERLVGTTQDFGHLQMTAAFAITATAADTTFSSIFFRRYPGLPLPVKLFCAFWMMMVGWLLGVWFLLLVRRFYREVPLPVRVGPFKVT